MKLRCENTYSTYVDLLDGIENKEELCDRLTDNVRLDTSASDVRFLFGNRTVLAYAGHTGADSELYLFRGEHDGVSFTMDWCLVGHVDDRWMILY